MTEPVTLCCVPRARNFPVGVSGISPMPDKSQIDFRRTAASGGGGSLERWQEAPPLRCKVLRPIGLGEEDAIGWQNAVATNDPALRDDNGHRRPTIADIGRQLQGASAERQRIYVNADHGFGARSNDFRERWCRLQDSNL
ncbi:hypothetical protein [Sphingopyxis fribergensis]|uniref:hypothetical protein n=1 Tax=Sphingopyxis fribergensis TaxID=1515612 RepID=UPI0011DDC13B|nr:hypothetical protein [Sphingopyxis fribergensis]